MLRFLVIAIRPSLISIFPSPPGERLRYIDTSGRIASWDPRTAQDHRLSFVPEFNGLSFPFLLSYLFPSLPVWRDSEVKDQVLNIFPLERSAFYSIGLGAFPFPLLSFQRSRFFLPPSPHFPTVTCATVRCSFSVFATHFFAAASFLFGILSSPFFARIDVVSLKRISSFDTVPPLLFYWMNASTASEAAIIYRRRVGEDRLSTEITLSFSRGLSSPRPSKKFASSR